MKKQRMKKLSLNRETLRSLEEEESLRAVVGGTSTGTRCRTDCGSCPASACYPTLCTC
jgi:natural product precursor